MSAIFNYYWPRGGLFCGIVEIATKTNWSNMGWMNTLYGWWSKYNQDYFETIQVESEFVSLAKPNQAWVNKKRAASCTFVGQGLVLKKWRILDGSYLLNLLQVTYYGFWLQGKDALAHPDYQEQIHKRYFQGPIGAEIVYCCPESLFWRFAKMGH